MTSSTPRRTLAACALAACALAATSTQAAPFSTTYIGQLGPGTNFADMHAGEPFTVSLVFDNGGNSANGQTWEAAHLTCVLWAFNAAQDVVYTQNLVAVPATTVAGTVSSDAGGTLTGMFTEVVAQGVAPGAYAASGFAAGPGVVSWFINGVNAVFFSGANDPRATGNPAGVSVSPADWSPPAPYAGPCPAPTPAPGPSHATAVPALGPAGLALLAGLLGLAGWRRKS